MDGRADASKRLFTRISAAGSTAAKRFFEAERRAHGRFKTKNDLIKNSVRALRGWEPFNSVLTTIGKAALVRSGEAPDWLVKHLPKSGIVQTRLPNGRVAKFWSHGDDWIANQIYWRGWNGAEPESLDLFYPLALQAETILDVGAHVGMYTVLAAVGNPAAKVYAFEPLPRVQSRLERNIALNRLNNVVCSFKAVSDREGVAEFYHVGTSDVPSSSSLSLDFMRTAEGLESVEVPVTTLDLFIEEQGILRVDLMKIDTETTEPEVLAGMAGALDRDRPAILCEVLPDGNVGDRLQKLLEPLGYSFFLITGDGPVRRDAIEANDTWRNYLFTTSADPFRLAHRHPA